MRCPPPHRAQHDAHEAEEQRHVHAEVLQVVEVLRPHLEVVGAPGRHHVLHQPHGGVQRRRRSVQEHLLQPQRRGAEAGNITFATIRKNTKISWLTYNCSIQALFLLDCKYCSK